MSGNRFGNRVGRNRDRSAAAPTLDRVVGEAEDSGRGAVGEVEGELEVGVGEEALAVADQHRPLEHVAVAIGRPGVADVVGAGKDGDAGRDQPLHRRHRHRSRAVGHDGDAGARERFGGAAELVIVDRAKGEGVADRDAAGEAERAVRAGDLAELEAAERTGIVEVDVDADAVPLGDPEDRIEMAVDVVVDAGGIESADEVGAGADRLVEEIGVPGSARMPLCGKATIWMSIRSRTASRTARSASRPRARPPSSMSTWLRSAVVP